MGLESIDIRQAVIHNIYEMDEKQLHEMVVDSIEQHEEKLLPGLGVVFELIWQNSDTENKRQMIETLHEHLPQEPQKPF